jgi:hypothetical protein
MKKAVQTAVQTAAQNQGDKKWQLQEDILFRVLQPQRYYQQPVSLLPLTPSRLAMYPRRQVRWHLSVKLING